jgi:ABC-type bacteriocin/lantibiotic exporter with double-glycine peptidase domain
VSYYTAVVVVVIGTPYILIAILPLCYYFIVLRGYFIKPSRDIRRIEGVSRSPIFTHLSETIDGLVTIRALGRLQAFTTQFNEYINKNASVYFAFVAVSRWLGFRLDTIVVVLLLVSTFGATAAKEYNAGIQPVILAEPKSSTILQHHSQHQIFNSIACSQELLYLFSGLVGLW